MNDAAVVEIVQRIASQLGTTAEHVWEIMVMQAHVSAIKSGIALALSLFGFVAVVLLGRLSLVAYSLSENPDVSRSVRSEADCKTVVCGFGCIVVALFSLCTFLGCGGALIDAAFNPEYVALMELKAMVAAMVN